MTQRNLQEQYPELEVVDLDAMRKPVGIAKLFGDEHLVLPISGRGADIIDGLKRQRQMGVDSVDHLALSRSIIEDIVPTLPAEQRTALSIEQMTGIIVLAEKGVEKVKQMIAAFEGNAVSPAPAEKEPGKKGGGSKPSTARQSSTR